MERMMSGIDEAFDIYTSYIYDEQKLDLLEKHNLKIAGSVPSVIWELFGAILTGRSGAGTTGADLNGWEVKSSKIKGNYEYQYHLNSGLEKLHEDCKVNHLFCSYSENYKNVFVRAMNGSNLEKFFLSWEDDLIKNYDSSTPAAQRRQRFRKNITYTHVARNGIPILTIKDGKISFRDDQALNDLMRKS